MIRPVSAALINIVTQSSGFLFQLFAMGIAPVWEIAKLFGSMLGTIMTIGLSLVSTIANFCLPILTFTWQLITGMGKGLINIVSYIRDTEIVKNIIWLCQKTLETIMTLGQSLVSNIITFCGKFLTFTWNIIARIGTALIDLADLIRQTNIAQNILTVCQRALEFAWECASHPIIFLIKRILDILTFAWDCVSYIGGWIQRIVTYLQNLTITKKIAELLGRILKSSWEYVPSHTPFMSYSYQFYYFG